MTSNPSKWLLDITSGRHGITESFLSLDIFSVTFKIYFWGKEEGGITPIAPPYGSAIDCSKHCDQQLTESTVNDAANAQIEDSKKGG